MNVPAEKLLPHRAPMLFINGVTSTGATACFGGDHFAVADGRVTEAALVECVAQTFAATLSQQAGSGEKTAFGMLAGVTNFEIHTRPTAGAVLEIEVRELKRLGPMRLITGTITAAGQLIAVGELTVYA